MLNIMEEFERNRRVYLGERISASEPVRRMYLNAMRHFVEFCGTEAQPRANRIREIKQDHYAQFMDSALMRSKSPQQRYKEACVIATMAENAGLKISINKARLYAAAYPKEPKANSD